ncbi:MAG: molecular chaperone DnaJ [Thermodesulfobacteriota bacterium]
MGKDYYTILGLERTASEDEIKKAFRRLAQELHPDKEQGDEEKFKEINEAYSVLKDPAKRRQYDQFGTAGVGAGYREAGFGGFGGGPGGFEDLFGEVFSDFFGGGRGGPTATRGADLRYDLQLTFEEAAFGTEKEIEIPITVDCSNCGGSGARDGNTAETCSGCGGSGQVNFRQGFLTIARPCGTCGGRGVVIKNPCASCAGQGKQRQRSKLSVKVPGGVDTGSRLRLAGKGEAGELGGPPGDLYVVVTVGAHEIFKREGDNILCQVPISFVQASLGCEIDVPVLGGTARLKIPAGTQPGKVFSLKGKGIASLSTGRRGEELVIIEVRIPKGLSKKQTALLEEFAEISGDEVSHPSKNLFSRVKEIFE